MAIKPITFEKCQFTSSQSARLNTMIFNDPKNANGYFKGARNELEGYTSGATFIIRSGLLMVQGRLIDVNSNVSIPLVGEGLGYIVAKICPQHTDPAKYCTFTYYIANELDDITLIQHDILSVQDDVKNDNLVYELPLFEFSKNGSQVTFEKLIAPIANPGVPIPTLELVKWVDYNPEYSLGLYAKVHGQMQPNDRIYLFRYTDRKNYNGRRKGFSHVRDYSLPDHIPYTNYYLYKYSEGTRPQGFHCHRTEWGADEVNNGVIKLFDFSDIDGDLLTYLAVAEFTTDRLWKFCIARYDPSLPAPSLLFGDPVYCTLHVLEEAKMSGLQDPAVLPIIAGKYKYTISVKG